MQTINQEEMMSKLLRRVLLPLLCAATVVCGVFGVTACTKKPKPDGKVYTVTIKQTEHGTVTANCETAAEGTAVTLTVTPDSNYYLDTLTVNGSVTEVKSGKATFTMPAQDVTVSALFVKNGEYAVRVGQYEHVSVKADKTVAAEGETVKLTVYVDFGYQLSELLANNERLTVTNGKAEFVMPASAVEITAEAAAVTNIKTGAAESDFEHSCRIMNDTATSYWSVKYGADALEISVYVKDGKINPSKDAAELYLGRSGYAYTKLSSVNFGIRVSADGTAVQYVVSGNEYVVADEEVFTVEASPWAENGTDVVGYFVKVAVSYQKLSLSAAPKDGELTLLPVLHNYSGTMGSAQTYMNGNISNPGSYPVLKGGILEENGYAQGTGALGGTKKVPATQGWNLSEDYAVEDEANYPNRKVVLNANYADNDILFFRNEGADVYAEATFKATGVNNGEKLGKFGLMLFDGASKNGVFYYVGADANGSSASFITGTGLGYTLTKNGDSTWGHDNVVTNVFSNSRPITLKMAYVAERGYLYIYYTPADGGEDVLVESIRYNASADVTIGFKSFNINLEVTNYFCTNDTENEAFAAHIPAPRFMGNNLGGTQANADFGSRWDISKDYKSDAANYADREVKLTGHDAADNNLYFIATEGKDAYVRATFKVDEVLNGEKWGKFGFMLFDGATHNGNFFFVDAFVGESADGVIRGRQLGYNYSPNGGWNSWQSFNKAGDVFNLDTKTITLAMSYKDGVISMYYENEQGQDVLVSQLVYVSTSSEFIIGIKSFAIALTVTDYKAITDPNDAEFAQHAPPIEQKDIDVLFAGDSYMEFWKNYGVWDTLTADLSAAGKKLENVGVGGTQVPYWDNGGMTGALKMQFNTEKIVFHIGVNDIDGGISVNDTYNRLVALFASYHSAFPNADIYWVCCIPNNFYIKNGGTYNAEYKQLNQKVKAYMESVAHLHYIDVETPFSTVDGDARTNLLQDSLHLSANYGYPLWTSTIKNALGYTVAGATSEILGDNAERGGERAATSGWSYGVDGNVAQIGSGAEFGKNVTVEEHTFYKGLYASDLLFEAEIRSSGTYHADEWSKVGVSLVNDDITILAYFETNSGGDGANGANLSYASLVSRANLYDGSKPLQIGDWDWNNQAGGAISTRDITKSYYKIGIAKLGSTIYLLVDGKVIASKSNFPAVTANSKFVAGVTGFNRYIEVKTVNAVSGADEVDAALAVPHNINVPEYEGVTITPDKTSAKKNETVTFTVNAGDSVIDKVFAVYGGNEHELTAEDGVYSFVMPDEEVALKVTFIGKMSVTLGADLAEKLNVSSLSVTQGQTVTFTAKAGYVIGKLYAVNGAGDRTEIVPVGGAYTLTVNENVTITGELFFTVDGIVLDGERDASYGEAFTEATLADNRNMQVWAKKTASGVLIYAMSHSNEFKNNGGDGTVLDWYDNSNFEFYLNDGVQRCINSRGFSSGVTKFYTKYTRLTSGEFNGKWENIYEIFVSKDSIPNFDNADVQLNYAFKTGNGIDKVGYASDYTVHGATTLNAWDWWGYHAIGGCDFNSWAEFNRIGKPKNLFISADGIKIVKPAATAATIDGNLEEYAAKSFVEVGDANKATFKASGFAGNDGLYLAITVTHGAWSPAVPSGDWSTNDNIEIHINCIGLAFVFLNGKLTMPAFVSEYATVTTQADGKNVTTIEAFIAGAKADRFRLQMGCNGNGFGGWQSLIWDSNIAYVTKDGVTRDNALGDIATAAGITLDGEFGDSVWTQGVKDKTYTATANGAEISVMGVNTSAGVLLGVTVVHTKPVTEHCQGDGTQWWNYMGPEIRLASLNDKQICATTWNNYSQLCMFGHKTVDNGDGRFKTTFEMLVDYGELGCVSYNRIALSMAGVFESGFSMLFGANNWSVTHFVTANGIVTA